MNRETLGKVLSLDLTTAPVQVSVNQNGQLTLQPVDQSKAIPRKHLVRSKKRLLRFQTKVNEIRQKSLGDMSAPSEAEKRQTVMQTPTLAPTP